jgi:hypothetical protein
MVGINCYHPPFYIRDFGQRRDDCKKRGVIWVKTLENRGQRHIAFNWGMSDEGGGRSGLL